MLPAIPSRRTVQQPPWVVLAPLGLLVFTSVVTLTHRSDPRRQRTTIHATAMTTFTVAPMISVGFTATPGVTSPAAAIARFSILRLPLTASVATISHNQMITTARIGSLHGP